MKRFLRIAFIIPILFLTSLFAFACGEVSMQSIALSINKEGVTFSNGYYNVEKTNDSITIDTVITPGDFSVQDLTWKSSNTNVVKVYYNSFKTINVGEATITASYQNKDGKIIKDTLHINVNSSNPEITFNANNLRRTYNGLDQKSQFIADQELNNNSQLVLDSEKNAYKFETGAKFYYQYYNYQTKQMTTELTDAGSYKILCKSLQDESIETTVDVSISKYKLTFNANTYNLIEYGDALPEGLINQNSIPSDFLTQTAIGTNFKGVGREENIEIGKKIDTTPADIGSNVSSYKTSVYYELKDEFKTNYELTANINQTNLNIVKKKVVIVVESQELVYGQSIVANKYKMYSYKNYTTAGQELVNLLFDTKVDYAANIYLGEPSYKIASTDANEQIIYTKTSLNSAGVLNVLLSQDEETILPYYLFYDNAVSRGNVDIAEIVAGQKVVPGEVKVNKRNIEVLPKTGQSKKYSQVDPENIAYQVTSGSFVSNDNLKTFLYVNYDLVLDNAGNDDFRENNPNYKYNYSAPVGTYFYELDNSLNKNYNITLNTQAIEVPGGDNTSKSVFEVKPCDIAIEFTDVTQNYKAPNSKDGKHTISYFAKTSVNDSGIVPNYRTQIKSLKVNGQEFVESTQSGFVINNLILDSNFENNGIFYVLVNKTPNSSAATYQRIGGFYMSLALTETATTPGCFASFTITPSIFATENPLTHSTNYKYEIQNTSKLNLNKIQLKVTPTMTESLYSKVYDATPDIQSNFGYMVGQANRDEYFTLDDASVDLNEIMSVAQILTLSFKQTAGGDDKYIKINDDGSEEIVEDMIQVGKYKVMPRDMSNDANNGFIEGKEYYELIFDSSKTYYYTVKPRTLTITPKAGQTKKYATAAQEQLLYTISNLPENSTVSPQEEGVNPVVIDGYTIAGALSRIPGESVGLYQIKLGNLDFGKNFVLSLHETPVNFEITKREVRIKPIEYSILYGENYPSQIGYEKEIIKTSDDELLNSSLPAPVFSGQFVIDGTKIGNYYPVRIDNGNVVGYKILQGSFVCDNNYSIVFVDSSTFTVNKRPIVLNIKAQSKTQTDEILTSGVIIDSEFYEITNLVDSATTELIINSMVKEGGVYTVDGFTLNIAKNSKIINYCYDVTLGKDVVYNIDVAMVYLKIMNNDLFSNTTNVVYNGYSRNNAYEYNEDNPRVYNEDFFLLAEDSDNFEIVKDNNAQESDLKQTKFNFEYYTFANNQQVKVNNPKDVGSYTAKINLGTADDDFRIVVRNKKLGEYVVFETLEDAVVDNYALSISNIGYLNITKANLTVTDSSLLSFSSDLEYKTSNISNIVENDYGLEKIIFAGVGEDRIILKKYVTDDFGQLNFKTSVTKEELLSYKANSEYILNLQVEAVKLNGLTPEVDASGNQISNSNYNPLFINVSLKIVPQKIVYNEFDFTVNGVVDGEIVYNSLAKSVDLNMYYAAEDEDPVKIESSNIVYNYEYVRLATDYIEEDGKAVGYLQCLGYVKESNTVTGEVYLSKLDNANTARRQVINGISYIIINEDTAVLISDNQEDVPKSAGIYICFATCQTDNNHTFTRVDEGTQIVQGQNVTFCCIYEIKKSQQISVDWKENRFYYTTVFDFANPNTLPFEYEIPAEVIKNVEYILEGDVEVPINNMLNVGEYNVSLKVDTKNYYYKQTFKFYVVDLPAVVVVPVNSTYVYTDSPIVSFMTSIGVTLKNKEGVALNTIYWTSQSTEFTFVFKKILEDNTKEIVGEYSNAENNATSIEQVAPNEVGNYVLEVSYESKEGNFAGTGEYFYSIIKKSYTGSIGFVDTTIYYQPNLTQEEFYNLIIARMFTIGIEQGGYTLSLHSETDKLDIKPNSDFIDYCTYNSVGQKTLLLTINFKDGITAPSTLKALLNIQRYTLEASDFAYLSNSTDYEYVGRNIYHALSYNGINLSPRTPDDEPQPNGANASNYTVTYEGKKVTVKDRLNHELFILNYVYTKEYNSGEQSVVEEYPIVPNTKDNNPNNHYRVTYNFSFGANYSGRNISYTYVDYTIRKSKLLNISFAGVEENTIQYTGEGQQEYVPANLNVKNNNIIGYSNLKYTICYDSSAQSAVHTESKGVYLLLYFIDRSGNKLKARDVVEVGTYRMYMTLYCSSSYKVSEYFEEFNFGIEGGLMTSFEQNIVNNEYGYTYSGEFKIIPKTYTASTITQVLGLTDYTIDGNSLKLSRSSTVLKILNNNNLTIKIQKASNGLDAWVDFKTDFDLSNLSKEYMFNGVSNGENIYSLDDTYCFLISDANHQESRIVFTLV